jgi:succinate dehydrogenase / fumarate reductase, membrane anchor subunit
MQTAKSSMRTPLSKVRGLGSARSGTGHFFTQRMTALANVPLAIAFIIVLTMLLGASHATFVASMKSPLVALLLLLFVVSGTIHMRLGMQVIIEDYVHEEGRKIALLIANTFFAIVIAASCVFAVLKMAFSG